MDNKEFNILLRRRARDLGLCDQWYDEWDIETPQEVLIEKYIKGIDFCIKNDYPKLDFIKAYVSSKMLAKHGVFVDGNIVESNAHIAVLLGKSNGIIRYNGLSTGNVYIRHESELTIEATDMAKVFVETYEGCKLKAVATGNSKIFVYWHGGDVNVSGNVTVRDKRKAEK